MTALTTTPRTVKIKVLKYERVHVRIILIYVYTLIMAYEAIFYTHLYLHLILGYVELYNVHTLL